MPLSRDQVLHIARLARLKFSDEELDRLTPRLDAIIGYVEQLRELDVTAVEPLAHPLPLHSVFREDTPQPSLTPDEVLANAPRRYKDFFAVPPTLE